MVSPVYEEVAREAVNERVWALVGASTNPDKFGNIILHDLLKAGYTVYPVNPRASEIDGLKCYPSLSALPEKPAVVDFVIPAKLTLPFLEEAAALGLPTVWFQPGAESEENISLAKELDLKIVAYACAMVQKHLRSWR